MYKYICMHVYVYAYLCIYIWLYSMRTYNTNHGLVVNGVRRWWLSRALGARDGPRQPAWTRHSPWCLAVKELELSCHTSGTFDMEIYIYIHTHTLRISLELSPLAATQFAFLVRYPVFMVRRAPPTKPRLSSQLQEGSAPPAADQACADSQLNRALLSANYTEGCS